MTIRKFARIAPVIAVLALAAPVASASAQTTGPGSMIPCYPEPAFCGPNGQPWFPIWNPLDNSIQWPSLFGPRVQFGPGPVQLPGR